MQRWGCLVDVELRGMANQNTETGTVLLQVDEAKEETDSGLLLTSASKEQPTIGKVWPCRLLLIQREKH